MVIVHCLQISACVFLTDHLFFYAGINCIGKAGKLPPCGSVPKEKVRDPRALIFLFLRECSYITRGGMGELRGAPENFLHRKGRELKCFQNTEVRT